MKKTSRRKFGKQLAGALTTLPLTAIVANTNLAKNPLLQNNRKEHDTPPPTLLMAGSWIFEATTEKDHDWSTATSIMIGSQKGFTHTVPAYDKNGSPAGADIHIGHIKIVDGSGEMLYRLDNDAKDEIVITTFMSKDKKEFVTVKTDKANFVLTFFEKRKLEKEDPSMDPEMDKKKKRQRTRYKDDSGNDGKIFALDVSGKSGTLYSLTVDGYKAASELRIMMWWEA